MTGKRLTVREMAVLGMLGALMFALKAAMMALPNIHPVAVFVIAGTIYFGWRMMYAVAVYVMLEGVVYGFGIWWISYLYIWPLLVCTVMLLQKNDSRLFWATAAGIFGLCFGALCAIPYFFIGGWPAAFSYWLSGIPFDIAHCAGNFAVTFALLPGLMRAMGAACGNTAK
ncbi:MAG: hypothetical protein IJB30_04755 [Clostridia bacterium]|nr:hypothetical protein [Clostridia bacterium]MBQ4611027.1 hypothetical protein [Clostridia bacterium]MBQ6704221.1 hypothetical protein [Clostridia bacterium]